VLKTANKRELDTIVEGNGTKHRPKASTAKPPFKPIKGARNFGCGSVGQIDNYFQLMAMLELQQEVYCG